MVSLQSFEHFGVVSLVDESSHHRKLLLICFFTIILTVLMPNPIDVSQKIVHKELKEENKLHHHSVISTVGTLLLKSSSQLISTREIAQLLQKCNFPGSLNYVDPYNSISRNNFIVKAIS